MCKFFFSIRIKIIRSTQIYWSHALELFGYEKPSDACQDNSAPVGAFDIVALQPEIPTSILDHDSDFEANVAKMAALNEEYVQSHWLPGSTTLCEVLAAGDI